MVRRLAVRNGVTLLAMCYAASYGPKRGQHLEPLHTLQARGILWSGGSDYFVTPVPARFGLWAAVAREPLKGTYGQHPFGTVEAIDMHGALRGYTAWAARQMFLERMIGTLEVGKKADVAVWEQDPYGISAAEVQNLKCLMTLLDGVVVYTAPGSPLKAE